MKIIPTLILTLCLGVSSTLFGQADLNYPLTKFTLESDNDLWIADSENKTVNLVSYFKAATNTNEHHERYSMNLSIVIDRSGSMSGEKLNKTKEAVNYLIKQLQPNDIVSVVSYESQVQMVVSPQKVLDKKSLTKKIDKISSGGSTFLSGGMEKGYEFIKSVKDTLQDPKYIHRVILLSDGLANVGIIDPQALTRIASDKLLSDNISLSTIGVGGDYNEKLMTDLAIQGTGRYYFVSTPADIPGIFKEELDGVQEIISKETILKIKFPENAVSLRQVHHYNYTLNGNEITFELNDVFANNEKAFLIEFDVIDGYKGDLPFTAELSYLNALKSLSPVKQNLDFSIKETTSKQDLGKSYRQIGSLTQIFMLSTESFQMATTAAEDGNFKEAESLLDTAMDAVKLYNSRFNKHPFLEDINNNIKDYKKSLKEMQKKPKNRRNFINRRHRSFAYRSISCPAF